MSLQGRQADGRALTLTLQPKMPPPHPKHLFLSSLVQQWPNDPDHAALLPADHLLAFAFERQQLARADFLSKADWALDKDKLDVALRLFRQALAVDPDAQAARN